MKDSLAEIQTEWTMRDIVDAHIAMDMLEDLGKLDKLGKGA